MHQSSQVAVLLLRLAGAAVAAAVLPPLLLLTLLLPPPPPRRAHRIEEVIQPWPFEHIHVHQPPVNLDWDDVVWVWDGFEGGVHQGLVQVKDEGLLVHVLRPLEADDSLAVHPWWLWWQLIQSVDELHVGRRAACGPLWGRRHAAQQVPQAVAPAAAAILLLLLLLLEELLLILLLVLLIRGVLLYLCTGQEQQQQQQQRRRISSGLILLQERSCLQWQHPTRQIPNPATRIRNSQAPGRLFCAP